MPFTLAHPAVILLLPRTRYLQLLPLAAGSLARSARWRRMTANIASGCRRNSGFFWASCRSCATFEQPARPLDVVGHGITEKVSQCTGYLLAAELMRRGPRPLVSLAAPNGLRPEQVEPAGRVRAQRGIVESLRSKGISATRDQQPGECFRHGMCGLIAFTAADHTDEYGELGTVRPAGVGIGARVQQEGRDRERVCGGCFDRQARVGEPQQRRPSVERVAIVGERGILWCCASPVSHPRPWRVSRSVCRVGDRTGAQTPFARVRAP